MKKVKFTSSDLVVQRYMNRMLRHSLKQHSFKQAHVVDFEIHSTETGALDPVSVANEVTVHGRFEVKGTWIKFCVSFLMTWSFGTHSLCGDQFSFSVIVDDETSTIVYKIKGQDWSQCVSTPEDRGKFTAAIKAAIEAYREQVEASAM